MYNNNSNKNNMFNFKNNSSHFFVTTLNIIINSKQLQLIFKIHKTSFSPITNYNYN